MFTWQCVYKDTAYHVRHVLIFPAATVQLTLNDNTASTSHTVEPSGRILFCIYIITLLLLLRTDGTKFAIATCETICSNCIKPLKISSVLPLSMLIVFSLCQSLLLMVALDKTSILHFSKLYETDFTKLYAFAFLPILKTHVCYYQTPLWFL